jgi:hypothetical protein
MSLVSGVLWFGAAPAHAADHSVFAYGDAPFHGSTGNVQLNNPIVGMARYSDPADPAREGYWQVARDGRVFTFGYAPFHGSLTSPPPSPVIGIAATPRGDGYWLATANGSIYSFGSAPFLGSLGNIRLAKPIVGIASTRSGGGYWMVAEDGGIFSFGDAQFHGSTGAMRLNQPIAGMASTPSGGGYWLVARDGGIFTFGDARFLGSTGAIRLARSIVGMAATPSGNGYWLVAADGGLFTFGDAPFLGSLGGGGLSEPAVAVVSSRTGNGYYIVSTGHLSPSSSAIPRETRISSGVYQVSAFGPVVPGTYRAQYATPNCHWERYNAAGVLASVTSPNRQIVTVKSGDTGFNTTGCAQFTSDLLPITRSLYSTFGDGDWLVNVDIGPGVWSAPGGPNCEWSRVADFSGDAAAMKASDNGVDHPVVHIDGSDAGFVTDGCGTWSPA